MPSDAADAPVPLAEVRALARAHASEESLSVLRHALRNKLAAVRNAAFYVKRRIAGSEIAREDARVVEFLDLVDAEVRAACDLIDGSKRAPGASEPPAIDVARALAPLASGNVVLVGSPGVRARVDGHELSVSVLNLIDNAIEAGANAVKVDVVAEHESVRVQVSDDGKGFSPEARDRAFSSFTTKDGHEGVGLAVVKRLIGRAGGRVELVPGPGETRVVLTLPGLPSP